MEALRGEVVRESLGLSQEHADDHGLTLEEIIKASGMEENTFRQVYVNWVDGESFQCRLSHVYLTVHPVILVDATYFQLYKRARHIITESLRVLEFRAVCVAVAGSTRSNVAALEALGLLMNGSQVSCSQWFECSCPELDQLTKICVDNGALGSRLTGTSSFVLVSPQNTDKLCPAAIRCRVGWMHGVSRTS